MVILVYITSANTTEAKRIATELVQQKLIACANIFPIQSIYPWKGKIMDEPEVVILGKTSAAKYGAIVELVEKIHTYETPCVLKISAAANSKYGKWLQEQVE